MNKTRKEKLYSLLHILYPQYKYIQISNNGFVKFGDIILSFIPIVKEKVHISELAITNIPIKLSKYRQGNSNYTEVYNKYLEYIILYQNCNVIDYLYKELLKIKSSSRVDILLENAQQLLPESNSDSITIGTIIKQTFKCKANIFNRLNESITLLERRTKSRILESTEEQDERLKFILFNRR